MLGVTAQPFAAVTDASASPEGEELSDTRSVLVIDCKVSDETCIAFADTGSALSAIDAALARAANLTLVPLKEPKLVTTINGQQVYLRHAVFTSLDLAGFHTPSTLLYVLPGLSDGTNAQVVLGLDWLTRYNAVIHIKSRKLCLTIKPSPV